MRILSLFILSAWFLAGCKTDDIEGVSPNGAPFIKIVSVTPTTIREFQDSITITIEYSDDNGDIGSDDPDDNSLSVKDARLPKPDYYFVKPLAPPGSNIKIKGLLKVQIKNTFLIGSGGDEYTTYELKLRDRAGNWSNPVTTEQLKITK